MISDIIEEDFDLKIVEFDRLKQTYSNITESIQKIPTKKAKKSSPPPAAPQKMISS